MYKLLDWVANNRRLAIILSIFLVFLLSIGALLLLTGGNIGTAPNTSLPLQGSEQETKLTWWITDNDSNSNQALQDIISKFKEKYPRVDITIQNKKSDLDFIEEFLSNPDNQPDIMTVESKNISFYQKYSSPNQHFTNSKLLSSNYLENSVDSVKNNNVFSGEIFGVSLSVDNLQMYVNKNLLNNLQGSKTAAKDWETLKLQAATFDKTKGQSLISLGGTEQTVQNFTDIFGSMMLQKGIYLDSKNKEINDNQLSTVMRDYNFFKQYQTRTDNDFDAFKQGKTLYYIDYFTASTKLKAENPNLDFEIVDLPKYPDGNNLSHAKFYNTLAHKQQANDKVKKLLLDDFIYFLSTEAVQKIYADKTGFPSANKTIVKEQYASKSDLDNNRKFFDQAVVARAIIPACAVKYREALSSLMTNVQSKGINPTTEDFTEIIGNFKNDILGSVFTQNVCLPYKFSD
jgi:ABC-type glycerol-3-phosphate transport system substrate-binding protein